MLMAMLLVAVRSLRSDRGELIEPLSSRLWCAGFARQLAPIATLACGLAIHACLHCRSRQRLPEFVQDSDSLEELVQGL